MSGDVVLEPAAVEDTGEHRVRRREAEAAGAARGRKVEFSSVGGSFNGRSVSLGSTEKSYGDGAPRRRGEHRERRARRSRPKSIEASCKRLEPRALAGWALQGAGERLFFWSASGLGTQRLALAARRWGPRAAPRWSAPMASRT